MCVWLTNQTSASAIPGLAEDGRHREYFRNDRPDVFRLSFPDGNASNPFALPLHLRAPAGAERLRADVDQGRTRFREWDGAGRPCIPGLERVDPPGALGGDQLRLRSRRQAGSRARGRHPSAPDRDRRVEGRDHVRVQSVLRRCGARPGELGRQRGVERGASAAREDDSARVSGEPAAYLECARERVGAARIRRGALRSAGLGAIAGMSNRW